MNVCSTEEGLSSSPIINIINNKVIGIYKGTDNKNNYNMVLFLNYSIEYFINYINNNKYIIKELNKRFNLKSEDDEN